MLFKPEQFLKQIFPTGFWERSLLNKDLDFKETAKRAILKATSLSGREVDATVDKVIKVYEHKRDLIDGTKGVDLNTITNGGKLLKQRLENLILYNEVQELKEANKGKFYRWLPSSAEEPDPQHQLLYGKIFKVGEGDTDGNMPSERYGCRCGIEILTDERKKDIETRLKSVFIGVKNKIKDIAKAVKTPNEFMPAETIAEAEQYANKFITTGSKNKEFDGSISYKGIDLKNANEINKTLDDIFNKFEIKKITGIKTIDPNSAKGKKIFTDADAMGAYSPVYKGIYLNKNILKNIENIKKYNEQAKKAFEYLIKNKSVLNKAQLDILARYETSKRSLVNNNLQGVIIHEIGHHIQWQELPVILNNEIGKKISKYAFQISGYASASKSEYIAESFSAYMNNEKNLIDPKLKEFFDSLLKKGA